MLTVAWVVAIELAVGIVLLGWFGLQVALLNARIMHAVAGQGASLIKLVGDQSGLIASVRVGEPPPPVALPRQDPYDRAWVPEDRTVGSS